MIKRVAIVGACAVVFAVAAYWWFSRPETLLQSATKVIRMVNDRDASGLIRYLREDELTQENLSADLLQGFLDQFYTPKLNGFKPEGEPTPESYPAQGVLVLTQKMRDGEGRELYLMIPVVYTDDGNKVAGLIRQLHLATMLARYDPNKPYPRGAPKCKLWATYISEDKSTLEQIGLAGLSQSEGISLKLDFVTWNQYIEVQNSAVAHFEQMEKELAKQNKK